MGSKINVAIMVYFIYVFIGISLLDFPWAGVNDTDLKLASSRYKVWEGDLMGKGWQKRRNSELSSDFQLKLWHICSSSQLKQM